MERKGLNSPHKKIIPTSRNILESMDQEIDRSELFTDSRRKDSQKRKTARAGSTLYKGIRIKNRAQHNKFLSIGSFQDNKQFELKYVAKKSAMQQNSQRKNLINALLQRGSFNMHISTIFTKEESPAKNKPKIVEIYDQKKNEQYTILKTNFSKYAQVWRKSKSNNPTKTCNNSKDDTQNSLCKTNKMWIINGKQTGKNIIIGKNFTSNYMSDFNQKYQEMLSLNQNYDIKNSPISTPNHKNTDFYSREHSSIGNANISQDFLAPANFIRKICVSEAKPAEYPIFSRGHSSLENQQNLPLISDHYKKTIISPIKEQYLLEKTQDRKTESVFPILQQSILSSKFRVFFIMNHIKSM